MFVLPTFAFGRLVFAFAGRFVFPFAFAFAPRLAFVLPLVLPFAFSFLFFGFLGLFSFAFVTADEFVLRFSFDSSGGVTVSGDSPALVGRLTSIATV
jgi:hypothetical protein